VNLVSRRKERRLDDGAARSRAINAGHVRAPQQYGHELVFDGTREKIALVTTHNVGRAPMKSWSGMAPDSALERAMRTGAPERVVVAPVRIPGATKKAKGLQRLGAVESTFLVREGFRRPCRHVVDAKAHASSLRFQCVHREDAACA